MAPVGLCRKRDAKKDKKPGFTAMWLLTIQTAIKAASEIIRSYIVWTVNILFIKQSSICSTLSKDLYWSISVKASHTLKNHKPEIWFIG